MIDFRIKNLMQKVGRVVPLIATIITYGSLIGGANAAVQIMFSGVPGAQEVDFELGGDTIVATTTSFNIFDAPDYYNAFGFSSLPGFGVNSFLVLGDGTLSGGAYPDGDIANGSPEGGAVPLASPITVTNNTEGNTFQIIALYFDQDSVGNDDFAFVTDLQSNTLPGDSLTFPSVSAQSVTLPGIADITDLVPLDGATLSSGFDGVISATSVPEPSSALFIGLSIFGFVARRRRAVS